MDFVGRVYSSQRFSDATPKTAPASIGDALAITSRGGQFRYGCYPQRYISGSRAYFSAVAAARLSETARLVAVASSAVASSA